MMWAERETYLIRQLAPLVATFPKGEGFTRDSPFSLLFYAKNKYKRA